MFSPNVTRLEKQVSPDYSFPASCAIKDNFLNIIKEDKFLLSQPLKDLMRGWQ